jgi:hypothetical protein
MKNRAQFSGLLHAVASEVDPLQSTIEFVFTDFAPNLNGMGVPRSESSNIISTGLFKPVKVDFIGNGVNDHDDAIPIGPIIELSEKDDKIIGKAVIWKREFPKFIEYLEEASVKEGEVQFSWELFYKNAEKDDSGIQWLQNCTVAAITIVSDPAYAGRTHLLSYAQNTESLTKRIQVLEETIASLTASSDNSRSFTVADTIEGLREQVQKLTDQIYSMASSLWEALDEAVPSTVDVEAVAQAYSDLVTRLKQMKSSVSTLTSELASVNTELAELRDYKASAEREKTRSEMLASRSQSLSAVMSADDITAKEDFILNLTEDQFAAFVSSLQTVSKASVNKSNGRFTVPDPVVVPNTSGNITIKDLAAGFMKARTES